MAASESFGCMSSIPALPHLPLQRENRGPDALSMLHITSPSWCHPATCHARSFTRHLENNEITTVADEVFDDLDSLSDL